MQSTAVKIRTIFALIVMLTLEATMDKTAVIFNNFIVLIRWKN